MRAQLQSDTSRSECVKKFLANKPPYPDFTEVRGSGGFVYLAGLGVTKDVKLGFSINPHIRLRRLRIDHCSPGLKILWEKAGNFQIEKELHEFFSEFRTKGEWFNFQGENSVRLVNSAYRALARGRGQ